MDWLEEHMNSIVLGNSYELIKKIPDNSIDCIYTDIPYLYDKYGKSKSEIGKRISEKHIEEMGKIISGIDYSIYDEFIRVMKKINCFIWCSKLQLQYTLNYFIEKGCLFEILTWNKTNPIPLANNSWASDIEYCLYFRERGVPLNDGMKFKSKFFTSALNKDDKNEYDFPAIKPLQLVKRHLLHATQKNDIVADFFVGSGTTPVAAKEINRRHISVEIDECTFNKASNRLNGINARGQTSIFTNFDDTTDKWYTLTFNESISNNEELQTFIDSLNNKSRRVVSHTVQRSIGKSEINVTFAKLDV